MRRIIVGLLIAIGLVGINHHYTICGRIWDWEQLNHHESFIALCFILAIFCIIGRFR